tara:strand:- start:2693 stop:2980 length:288 start_codon:yes stop_codon:yes gene_type:complete
MANKKAILNQLADYFAKKGSMMTPSEFKAADDAPMRYMVAKRPFGSWVRMQGMIKINFPDQWAKANKEAPAPAPKAEAPKVAPKKAKAAPKKAEK